jgi:predicted O-methyltransferase YrrM
VDDFVDALLIPADTVLEDVVRRADAAGLIPMHVSAAQGRFLQLLVGISNARRVLEIGTLAGYSAIWMARALPADGQLVTLEVDPTAAEVARTNFDDAGVDDRIELLLGPASQSLAGLAADEPFDLVFIDADKPAYPEYLAAVLRLSRSGTVIVADNVVRDGAVAEADHDDERVVGVRRFLEAVSAEPRLAATVLQTVGVKGYDGFCLAVVH